MDKALETIDPIVTDELIERCRTGKGGWSRAAASYLGVCWPLERGWQKMIRNLPREPLEEAPKSWPAKLEARAKHAKHHKSRQERQFARSEARAHASRAGEARYVKQIARDRERARLIDEQRREAIAESKRLSTRRR